MLEKLTMDEMQMLYKKGNWAELAFIRDGLPKQFNFRIEPPEDKWGNFSLIINNKVELYLESHENLELFPFSIVQSDKKASQVDMDYHHAYFYVSSYDFKKLSLEMKKIYSEYPYLGNGVTGIPDIWFADTFLVKYVSEVIIPNKKIQEFLRLPTM